MKILCDTRERNPLTFQMLDGVTVESKYLDFGDYACVHNDGTMDKMRFERKSVADAFSSFSGDNYLNEKRKIARAKTAGSDYSILIEAPLFEVRKGCTFKKGGEIHEVRKSGIAQIRQLLTISRKYGIGLQFFQSRSEMAFYIQEFFLTQERLNSKEKSNDNDGMDAGNSEKNSGT